MSHGRGLVLLALVVMLSATVVLAADRHVPGTYATIQAAIDASDPGDTIIVAPGYYHGIFRVWASKPNLTIKGDASGYAWSYDSAYVYAPGTTIERMVFYGSGDYYGIYVGSTGSCTIRDVVCYYQRYGIYASGAAITLSNVRCYYNQSFGVGVAGGTGTLAMNGGRAYYSSGLGVIVYSGAQGTLTGVSASYNTTSGLSVQSGGNASFENCSAYANEYDGLLVHYGSATVIGGSLNSNTYYGARCYGDSADMTVSGTTVYGNGKIGIYYDNGATGTISNAAAGYSMTGIWVGGGSSCDLSQTLVRKNSYYGLSAVGSATATDCDFVYNTGYYGYGVRVGYDSSVELDNCRMKHNRYGLSVYQGSVQATDCYINLNSVLAADIVEGEANFEGGQAISNGSAGLLYSRDSAGAVRNMEVADNYNGVVCRGGSPVVEGNYIHDNRYIGVRIENYPGSWFHGKGLVFDPDYAVDDRIGAPTITGNTFEANSNADIYSLDGKPTNLLTLDTDNTFVNPVHPVTIRWYGAVRVMRNGTPFEGVDVEAISAVGTWSVSSTTNTEGYAPLSMDFHSAVTWWQTRQYMTYPDMHRAELNPHTVRATADGGNLRGSTTYCWNGEPKSEGFDIDGRYQIAYLELNARPIADAGDDRTVEANTTGGADVTLDASGCSDEDGDELTFIWKEGDTVLAGPTTDTQAEVFLALGEHTITLVVDDGQDDPVSDQCVITVVDTTPPTFILDVLESVLWPPDHRMVKAAEVHSLEDICDPNPTMTITVSCNEPADGTGDGSTESDWEIVDTGTAWEVWLRAERCGDSVSRVYTIEAVAGDASGNTSTQTADVTVPHDMG
ncbi:MAG: right-handed parallel beta-helix repeat-containing protein [Armatimonadota bacterium]